MLTLRNNNFILKCRRPSPRFFRIELTFLFFQPLQLSLAGFSFSLQVLLRTVGHQGHLANPWWVRGTAADGALLVLFSQPFLVGRPCPGPSIPGPLMVLPC